MRRLDRYLLAGLLQGYFISMSVLLGLRIVIDLFVNLDEFTRHADLSGWAMAWNVVCFYAVNSTLYFRDFAGLITVLACAFCLGRLVRSNELVAIMASGISLRRVMAPLMAAGVLLTGLLVIDQELVIPALADRLARPHSAIPGRESYQVYFIPAQDGSLVFSPRFDVASSTLSSPVILLRRPTAVPGIWAVTGCIVADSATYNPAGDRWDLAGGRLISRDPNVPVRSVATFAGSGLLPRTIPVLARSEFKGLLSWRQLDLLGGLRPRDLALVYSQKHSRLTEPLINIVMLLVGLPVLLCRDPRDMKSAVLASFCLTGACMIFTFICRILSTESVLFGRPVPQFWAWLPVLVFAPIGLVELDAVKT